MPFGSLAIPVIVATIVVFIASSVLHMALKLHKSDYRGLPNEEAVRDVLGKASLSPGNYFVPYCSDMKQLSEPTMKEKFVKGPVAIITVRPSGPPAMGKYLALWFGYCFLVTFVTAYVARQTMAYGADGMHVMRVITTIAFLGHGLPCLVDSIWKGQPWSNTFRFLIDGAVYSLLTGLCFLFLWPAA
jgi:hypothetical protein